VTDENYYIVIEDPDGVTIVYSPEDNPPTPVISVKGGKGDPGGLEDLQDLTLLFNNALI